jgi:hypothetical protein
MSLEKEPAGAFNKAQRLIEQRRIYTLFATLQAAQHRGWFCKLAIVVNRARKKLVVRAI